MMNRAYLQINRIVFLFIALLLFPTLKAVENDGSRYAANSVLSAGNWFKIKISDTGIYKLTYEDLKQLGLVNPKNVKLYGYGGWILDENFSQPYVDDLPKVSIWMNNPDNFGPGDYILFYARGDIKWTYSTNLGEFVHEQNPYSSDSYYFVTENDDQPNLIKSVTQNVSGVNTMTSYDDYALHEKNLVNIVESGREFYGENFITQPTQTFHFELPGIVASSSALIRYDFIAKTGGDATLNIKANSVEKKETIKKITDSYSLAATLNSSLKTTELSDDTNITLSYTPYSSSDANVYLNYIRVNYTRQLKPYGVVTLFRSRKSENQLDYIISEATSNMLVFDVTNNSDVTKINATLSGTQLSFGGSNLSSIREYALVDISKKNEIPTPELIGKIPNQNLHSLLSKDMVIISQPFLHGQAAQLAALHKNNSGLECLIVDPNDIYNEFSSGKPDATAYRRFMKMFYDRATNDAEKPKYLLLFGDGSYDNKMIEESSGNRDNKGLLLTYQSVNSLSTTGSYVTDDYFGFLDDSEGVLLKNDLLDIGIGRLTVNNEYEASVVIDKINKYMKNEANGIWQNMVTFVSDDAVAANNAATSEIKHIQASEKYSNLLKTNYPAIISNKIYEDAFERFVPMEGATTPGARNALLDRIKKGMLVLNYVGHGSTTGWTHERMLTYTDFDGLKNTILPLWITATCDFSRFDTNSTSGGEAVLLNPDGGAIALFSTVRIVYSANNDSMCVSLFRHLFDEENGKPLRLGDIMQRAKRESNLNKDDNKLRFFLLGDPALRLNYPGNSYSVQLTSVNGSSPETKSQIKALGQNTIIGQIVDRNGYLVSDFNGSLQSVIFDNEQTLATRGARKDGETYNTVYQYNDYPNIIYSGTAAIKNGTFEISFITPQNILYSGSSGKMSFYASNADKTIDASGYFTNYVVDGVADNIQSETNVPIVGKFYLEDESFQAGGAVYTSTPVLYAYISDDSGINQSGSEGNNISLIIDGLDEYNISSSFVSNESFAKSGYIQYQLPELSDGVHSLQLKVWDVWNNSVTKNMDFRVEKKNNPHVYNFTLSAEQARESVDFIFTSDIPNSKISVEYSVYSQNGDLQWTHKESGVSSLVSSYCWDLKGNNGSRLVQGIYTCYAKILVDDAEESSKTEKLIILGQ